MHVYLTPQCVLSRSLVESALLTFYEDRWDDVNAGYLPEGLGLNARREVIEWVHSEGVYESVPMQETVGSDLDGHRQVCRDCVPGNTRRRGKANFNEPFLPLSCSLRCHFLKL